VRPHKPLGAPDHRYANEGPRYCGVRCQPGLWQVHRGDRGLVKACRSPHGITSSFVLYANPLLGLSRQLGMYQVRGAELLEFQPRVVYTHTHTHTCMHMHMLLHCYFRIVTSYKSCAFACAYNSLHCDIIKCWYTYICCSLWNSTALVFAIWQGKLI